LLRDRLSQTICIIAYTHLQIHMCRPTTFNAANVTMICACPEAYCETQRARWQLENSVTTKNSSADMV